MGIRVLCNHCQHLLNVKTHLAGRAGVCPECKHKIWIPKISSRPSKKTPRSKGVGRQKTAAGPKSPPALRQSPELIAASDDDSFLLAKPANPWLHPNAPDPLETGMRKVWYIRHPSNGETGPVKGKHLPQMIADKKIEASCYVWREDWEDWIRADLVFRQLGTPKSKNAGFDRVFTDPDCPIPKAYIKKATAADTQKIRLQILLVIAIVVGIATIGALAWLLASLL